MNKLSRSIITLLIIVFLFISLYKVKSALGINIIKGKHFPNLVDKATFGLIPKELFDHNYIP